MVEILLIFTKGTCPNLAFHKILAIWLWDAEEEAGVNDFATYKIGSPLEVVPLFTVLETFTIDGETLHLFSTKGFPQLSKDWIERQLEEWCVCGWMPPDKAQQLWHLIHRKYRPFLALPSSRGLCRQGSCNKQEDLLKLTMPLSCRDKQWTNIELNLKIGTKSLYIESKMDSNKHLQFQLP